MKMNLPIRSFHASPLPVENLKTTGRAHHGRTIFLGCLRKSRDVVFALLLSVAHPQPLMREVAECQADASSEDLGISFP